MSNKTCKMNLMETQLKYIVYRRYWSRHNYEHSGRRIIGKWSETGGTDLKLGVY